MLRELRTSQLLEYKKLLTTVLNGIDTAITTRQGLIEYDTVSKYEHAKYDSLNDPEPYYHIKLFDKAIGIVRLYNKRDWLIEDDDSKYFHFAIRCYNFYPDKNFNLKVRNTDNYATYGDFLDIDDCIKYFYVFSKQLFINAFNLQVDLFEEIY